MTSMRRNSVGSRLRTNPTHLFECFCEVVAPSSANPTPFILQKFPETYVNEEVLKPLPGFTFPCEIDVSTIEHFSFVLTNSDSKWAFGFTRHTPGMDTALVFISFLPWHSLFFKLLNKVADLINRDTASVSQFLSDAYILRMPSPGSLLKVPSPVANDGSLAFSCVCPDHTSLPTIPENRNLVEYYNAVSSEVMLEVFASMLHERRIVMVSRKLSRLTGCVQAANLLIEPMYWQHIFIPVLPFHLVDYLSAPMPFLVGVPRSTMEKHVRKAELGDAVIVDLDDSVVHSPYGDLKALPSEVVSGLRRKLTSPQLRLGDGIARSFLIALVQLIGGYREALVFRTGQKITFDRSQFLQTRQPSMRPFLQDMLQLQIFQQFIDERLAMLNAGEGFSDQFELEACLYSEKSSAGLKTKYTDWRETMKREGGALLRSVKDKAKKSAVKNAVTRVKIRGKNVRERGVTTYKGLRHRVLREGRSKHFVLEGKKSSAGLSLEGSLGAIHSSRSTVSLPEPRTESGFLTDDVGASGGSLRTRNGLSDGSSDSDSFDDDRSSCPEDSFSTSSSSSTSADPYGLASQASMSSGLMKEITRELQQRHRVAAPADQLRTVAQTPASSSAPSVVASATVEPEPTASSQTSTATWSLPSSPTRLSQNHLMSSSLASHPLVQDTPQVLPTVNLVPPPLPEKQAEESSVISAPSATVQELVEIFSRWPANASSSPARSTPAVTSTMGVRPSGSSISRDVLSRAFQSDPLQVRLVSPRPLSPRTSCSASSPPRDPFAELDPLVGGGDSVATTFLGTTAAVSPITSSVRQVDQRTATRQSSVPAMNQSTFPNPSNNSNPFRYSPPASSGLEAAALNGAPRTAVPSAINASWTRFD